MVRPSSAILGAAILLGGCHTAFDLVGVAEPLSASEARNFNGSYQGVIKQISQSGVGCPTEHGEKVVMVGEGVLWYAYTPTESFAAPVSYDGFVRASSGSTELLGRIVRNHLSATIQSPTCRTELSMNFVYNHS